MNKNIAQIYKGKSEEIGIQFSRVWAMPSPWTFEIRPIKNLLDRYMDSGIWIDPFAGKYSPADITNDHNPERNAQYHMEALAFVSQLQGKYQGILFAPPYSFRQVKKHYQCLKQKVAGHTTMAFYAKVKSAACEKINSGGYAISCGWNTNGFGKRRGFEIIEIMCVAHGGSRNDTIVTVEKKI